MAARTDLSAPPDEFQRALEQFRGARLRPEVFCEEMPAPQRIAPFAAALSADLVVRGDEIGGGRLVLLYDPDGNDAWEHTFRCVAYVRAHIDPDMVTDPLLADVAWTWLTESLELEGAQYRLPSGTVTRVASDSFGGMSDDAATAEIEVRASWSPLGDIGGHVTAWGELLCTAGGLPPMPGGVALMRNRRGQRGR